MKPIHLYRECAILANVDAQLLNAFNILSAVVDVLEQADRFKWNVTGMGNSYGVQATEIAESLLALLKTIQRHKNQLDKEVIVAVDSNESPA